MEIETPTALGAVPRKVFEEFISELRSSGMDDDVVARLQLALLSSGDLSEKSLRLALFPED